MMNDECGRMNESPNEIIRILDQVYGRDISLYDESFLMKSIDRRLAETGLRTYQAYAGLLSENLPEALGLFQSLNINYSEFFRNALTFAVLEQIVLPCLVEAREKTGRAEIRIWSAGCAAGQEVYSVALLLDELAAVRGKPVPCRIFATDTNASELVAAQKGVFETSAVKNVRLKHLRTAFTQQGELFTLAPRIRNQVDFSDYDLLDGDTTCPAVSIFGDFDLILCANLLFYYRPDVRELILKKLHHCLKDNGYLVTGEAERMIVRQISGFHAVVPPASVFQKTPKKEGG
jgi:chemotaxis protein methyltransferase CheR